jgi:hypothetical protein
MADAVSRRHITAQARVRTEASQLEFVLEKVVLGRGFLWVRRFSPVTIIKKNHIFTFNSPTTDAI